VTMTHDHATTDLYIGLWATHLYLPWPPWPPRCQLGL